MKNRKLLRILSVTLVFGLLLAGCEGLSPVDAQTPNITVQPEDAIYTGSSITLRVTASVTDGGTLSYQWYSNTAASNENGTLINGETSTNYRPVTTVDGTFFYYVAVTNKNGNVSGKRTRDNKQPRGDSTGWKR